MVETLNPKDLALPWLAPSSWGERILGFVKEPPPEPERPPEPEETPEVEEQPPAGETPDSGLP